MAGLVNPISQAAPTLRPLTSGGVPAATGVPAVPLPPAPVAPPVQSAAQPTTLQSFLFGPQAVAQAQANPDPLGRAGALVAGGLSQLDRILPRDPNQVVGDIYHGVQGLFGAAGRFAQGFTGSAAQAAQPVGSGAGLVSPAAAATVPGAGAAVPQPAAPVLAGKGLYAYDTATGPTVDQAAAIKASIESQAYRNGGGGAVPVVPGPRTTYAGGEYKGQPLIEELGATGQGLTSPTVTHGSPASQQQPALAQAAPQIPLALAAQVNAARQAQQRNATLDELSKLQDQDHNQALLDAGTDKTKLAKARTDRISQLLTRYTPPSLEANTLYGGLATPP